MKERSFDEMIAYFNRRVSEMDIAQDYKIELLGMVTALGYKHEKTAQQERKTGKWVQENPFTKPRCSECGAACFGLHGFDYKTTPYCPECGARMEE